MGSTSRHRFYFLLLCFASLSNSAASRVALSHAGAPKLPQTKTLRPRLPAAALQPRGGAGPNPNPLQAILQRKVPAYFLVAAVALGVSCGYGAAVAGQAMRIFRTSGDIPSTLIDRHGSLSGRVISITDGDTFRMRHKPFLRSGRWTARKLSDDTIVVRIAAVDTPEVAKMGKPGQPFGEEAKAFASKLALGKVVKVKLLRRDQYNRVVCTVSVPKLSLLPPSLHADLSMELVKAGLAVVYRQAGAEYDGRKDAYEAAEAAAKHRQIGVWGQKNFKPPSEFKKAMKQ